MLRFGSVCSMFLRTASTGSETSTHGEYRITDFRQRLSPSEGRRAGSFHRLRIDDGCHHGLPVSPPYELAKPTVVYLDRRRKTPFVWRLIWAVGTVAAGIRSSGVRGNLLYPGGGDTREGLVHSGGGVRSGRVERERHTVSWWWCALPINQSEMGKMLHWKRHTRAVYVSQPTAQRKTRMSISVNAKYSSVAYIFSFLLKRQNNKQKAMEVFGFQIFQIDRCNFSNNTNNT